MFINPATAPQWVKVTLLADVIFGCLVFYNLLYWQTFEISLAILSESVAATAGILLGFSFALSGMSYFFNFLDSKLHYRKQLGLVGYYFALAYSFTLVFRFPEKYGYGLFSRFFEAEVILGLAAMLILTGMAIISHPKAIQMIGAAHWRGLLRTGYVAYVFLVVRAFLIEGASWQQWLMTIDRVPPPRLLLTIFALAVIILRIVMQLSIRFFPKQKPVESSVPKPVLPAVPAPIVQNT